MDDSQLAERIADAARREQLTVAVAESLTGGLVASRLAAAPAASRWFRGGVVAYAAAVKHDLLRVPDGPVVSEAAATAMARQVAALLGADLSVALTGVGGPGRQDDQPPGTVWFAVLRRGRTTAVRGKFRGGPAQVCAQACTRALRLLDRALDDAEPAAQASRSG